MQNQEGFTLIELIVVIVILGLLAVVAVPKYIDLTTDASTAAVSGIASGLASANGLNYAARKANVSNGVAIANCTDMASTLMGGIPAGYTITAAAVAVDASVTCTVTGPNSTTATFIATGIS